MIHIVFVHPAFPGQFLHICQLLRELANVEITFISDETQNSLERVRSIFISAAQKESAMLSAEDRGIAVANAIQNLCDSGKPPDVIIAYAPKGDCLFLKALHRDIPLICFPEWYFQPDSSIHQLMAQMSYPAETRAKARQQTDAMNLVLLKSALDADRVVVATQFQKAQFPEVLRERIEVLHDGIQDSFFDLERDQASDLRINIGGQSQIPSALEIVTFVTRSLDPLRGYHQFLEATRILCKSRPDTIFLVAGNENWEGYIPRPPNYASWRQFLEEKLPPDRGRVHFLGLLDHDSTYRQLLLASSVHVYLTAPYVLSWSLVESMAAGCAIVASDTPPVTELIEHGISGLLVPFDDASALAGAIEKILDESQTTAKVLGQNARITAQHYRTSRVTPIFAKMIADSLPKETSTRLHTALEQHFVAAFSSSPK